MKEVLFVINTLGQAGAETALIELLRRLDPEEYHVSLYVLLGQGEMVDALPGHVKLLNDSFDRSSVLSKEGHAKLKKTVMKAMLRRATWLKDFGYLVYQGLRMVFKRRIQADKLLWRVLSDGGLRFDKEFDLAVAFLEGGATYYVADHVKAKKKAAFIHVDYNHAGYTRSLDKDCYLKYQKIFTVSEEVRKSFLYTYMECEDVTEVFHNLLDIKSIREKADDFQAFDDGYDGKRIVTVGRLTSQKAFEVSVETMKLLKERGKKVRWYVYGEGDQRPMLEELIAKYHLEKDFFLPGAVSNPYPYMKEADLYVHASRFEGKSIAIQEAQILGKPIVVSDCSGNREQVIQGVDGLLCDFQPEALCLGICDLLENEDKAKRLGEAAAKKNDEEHTDLYKLFELM